MAQQIDFVRQFFMFPASSAFARGFIFMIKTLTTHETPNPLELINQHLYSVEERIRDQARSFDPAVEGYVAYAVESRGKRLRPALALLAGGATGNITAGHIDLAVIVELIHVASLVHDDIIDGAELRRDQPTANAKWGSAISVLLGDVLFSHALKLATNFHNTEVSRRIATATSQVCSGEIIQTQRRFDLKLSVPEYFRIIEMKTAALFAVSAELGAFINDSTPDRISALKHYGMKLGTAYQVYDDILDIAGTEAFAGKSLGTDLERGKLTLPLITAMKHAGPDDRDHLRELILDSSRDTSAETRQTVIRLGGLRSAVDTALQLVDEATARLAALDKSRHKSALLHVGEYLAGLIKAYK